VFDRDDNEIVNSTKKYYFCYLVVRQSESQATQSECLGML
jgi:hypothetical protein